MDLSLHASRSAILASTQNQSVIANNMANVSTYGFKKVSQHHSDFIVPGTQVVSTRLDFSDGSVSPTNRKTDVSIQGDGFFQVDINGAIGYTRAGNFEVDRDGTLVTPQGYKLNPNITVPEQNDVAITVTGQVLAQDPQGNVTELGQLEAVRFPNNHGLVHIGDGIFKQGPNSGSPINGNFGDDGFPGLLPKSLEESNVDLADEFTTQLVNQRWFQGNIRVFQSTDQMIGETMDLIR